MHMFLVIVFFVTGTPTAVDGWGPTLWADQAQCEQARDRVKAYLALIEAPYPAMLLCVPAKVVTA